MQVIYGDASNINLTAQKRLLRVVYGQTQATPFAGTLDPSLRDSEGNIRVPKEKDKTTEYPYPEERTANAYTLSGSVVPGIVLTRTTGEHFTVAAGTKGEQPFGLLGQWVGGTFDNLKQTNQISAWIGPDSVFDILAPAFNAENELSAALAEPGVRVLLFAGPDGRLIHYTSATTPKASERTAVAEAIEVNPSAGTGAVLRIKLLI